MWRKATWANDTAGDTVANNDISQRTRRAAPREKENANGKNISTDHRV